MDKKVENTLSRISASVTERLGKGLIKKERDYAEMAGAEAALSRIRSGKHNLTLKAANSAEKHLSSIIERNEKGEETLDRVAEQKLSREMDLAVKRAIANGTIPAAKRDDFIQMMRKRLKK